MSEVLPRPLLTVLLCERWDCLWLLLGFFLLPGGCMRLLLLEV